MINPGQMFLIAKGVLPCMSGEGTVKWVIDNIYELAAETELSMVRKKEKEKLINKYLEKKKELATLGATLSETEKEQKQQELKALKDEGEGVFNHSTTQEFAYNLRITYDSVKGWVMSKS